MIIRNDDVAADTTLAEIRTFCEICDRYGVGIIHCITPLGAVRPVRVSMTDEEIVRAGGCQTFGDNWPVQEYLLKRNDQYAVHGLWHTHAPDGWHLRQARSILEGLGFPVDYYCPPFNEGEYPRKVAGGLKVIQFMPRLEEYLDAGDPGAEMTYLHSWRFEHGPFTWRQLDACLKRLTGR